MTTEDHTARVEQILSEARKEALVTTTWTCSMDSEAHEPLSDNSSCGLGLLDWLIPMLIGFLAAHAFVRLLS